MRFFFLKYNNLNFFCQYFLKKYYLIFYYFSYFFVFNFSYYVLSCFFDKFMYVILSLKKNIIQLNKILLLHNAFYTTQLIDITAVDLLKTNYRFLLIYNYLNINYNFRFLINIKIKNFFEIIESSSLLFLSANWLEREVWDMFGLFFKNHRDLRRILTDYLFVGYPLRKDFPLSGYFECVYDELIRNIIYVKISFQQLLRIFKFSKIW